MVLTPPSGGMECDVLIALGTENGKASMLYQFTFVELSSLTFPSSCFVVFGEDVSPDDPALTLMFPAVAAPPQACVVFNIDDDDDVECDHSASVVFDSVINCVVDPPILSASLSTTITISDNDGTRGKSQ